MVSVVAVSGKKAPVGRTLGRLLLESLPALIIASLFTAWTYCSATDRESIAATDLVSRFGAAFFFVMWMVGQYLRVSKQLGIEAFLAEIREGVNHIRDALPTPTQPAEPALLPSTGAIVATRALLTEAESTLEAGNPRAALMVAGAALEEAVREFARARGVADWDRASPSALMRTIGGVLSPQGRQALHAMWDLL